VFCHNCGHRNPEGANFCSSCGAALEHTTGEEATLTLTPADGADGPDDDISVHLDGLPEGMGLLVVKRGPNAGSKYTLDHPVTTAGRHPDSDIFLDDITVSRRHAEFRRETAGYTVVDVGSLNGTYLNRARIDDAGLANGDEVQIGKFRLVFLSGSAPGS
jgi:pSer/pThr/pTyr-binding forkhead associated (FHA) protein